MLFSAKSEKLHPMVKASFLGLRAGRFLVDAISREEIEDLQSQFGYLLIISFTPIIISRTRLLTSERVLERKTPLIDLFSSLDDIWSKFKKNTRNEIRKTEKMKELSFRVNDQDKGAAYALYKRAKRLDGVQPEMKREFSACPLFTARLDGRMIASVVCYDTGKILRLKSIVSLRKEEGFDNRITGYATRRIIWDIIRFGKEHGYRALDLGGINHKESAKDGVAQFKESFGAPIVDAYIYRYDTFLFKIARAFFRIFGYQIN